MSDFILASSSITRLELLKKACFVPKHIASPDVDETPLKKEKPTEYLSRIPKAKAEKVMETFLGENILAADSIVSLRGRVVQKLKSEEDIVFYYKHLYSGRRIRALTGVYFINKTGKTSSKIVESIIKFKHLSEDDINTILKHKETLLRCAGGISIELLECITIGIIGSYSNIRGLPLYEVRNMLLSNGIKSDDGVQVVR
ncbi:MAG: Maf family protein [Rickettsiales bacterium]|jgi:septum formation protein|nr:Maf family protein [Rickettsiales bacterium]